MALKKIIAGYLKPDGTWEEQQEVDMHPLDEAATRAHWAVGESLQNEPQQMTLEEEHELLINGQIDLLKQKRLDYQHYHSSWSERHQILVDAHRKAANEYEAWANRNEKN